MSSCYTPNQIKLYIPVSLSNKEDLKKCKPDLSEYASKSSSAYSIPERTIKLNFYIIDNKEGNNNFSESEGRTYIEDLIRAANNKLRNNGTIILI